MSYSRIYWQSYQEILFSSTYHKLGSEKDAHNAVKIGFLSLTAMAIIMKIAVMFEPAEIKAGIANFASIKLIFDFMPRVLFAGLVAYGVSQTHDVCAYSFWRKKFPANKYIWIRNNASTLVSQFIDTLIFTLLAFYGIYDLNVLVEIFFFTYVMKVLVAICDTPFVYMARLAYDKGKIRNL